VGLQIGGTDREVSSVAVCHEVTSTVVDRMGVGDIDVLVSYHPLLFAPTTTLVEGPDATGRAMALAESGTSLIVVHTAFDVLRPGTADALLVALGLEATDTFAPVDDEGGSDIGRIAHLPSPRTLGTLAEFVGTETRSAIRYNMSEDTQISSIGVVSGSGDSFIDEAIGRVDCYITGDVSHHGAARALGHGLAVIDAGHAPTELRGIESLYSHIVELVPTATMLDDDANPWRV
jgi:dinuclear metal center YbgI/SA1388 family protein